MPDEVVLGRRVVVLHHEPQHGQLGDVDLEPETFIPRRVEPCREASSFSNVSQVIQPRACVCVRLTVVIDVVRRLDGVVRRHAVDLHPHQRVNDGALFVLVEFG